MTTARQLVKEVIQTEIDRLELTINDSLADEMRLWEWGRWARATGSNLGYPKCLLPFTAKGWGEKDLRKHVGEISDEDALEIERAVVTLPKAHRTVIVAIYRIQVPQRRLMMVMKTSMRQVDYLHHQALGMLWAKLRA